MDYILDTNILLIYLRDKHISQAINKKYHSLAYPNSSVISVVTIGELKSIALQNNWGTKRIEKLKKFMDHFLLADINVESIINRYAEIDAFSQGKLKDKPLRASSRNMGKNDLWIAATASILNIPLITVDKDFLHLDKTFLKLEYFNLDLD